MVIGEEEVVSVEWEPRGGILLVKKNRIMKIKKINKENLFITYRHERRMRQPFSVKYTSS